MQCPAARRDLGLGSSDLLVDDGDAGCVGVRHGYCSFRTFHSRIIGPVLRLQGGSRTRQLRGARLMNPHQRLHALRRNVVGGGQVARDLIADI
jgi:hypothetical protein